jgi:hypothetical protein
MIQIYGILFDNLTADPGAPSEGQMWYNVTDKRIKVYRNGATQQWVDLAEHLAHVNNLANPHQTDLESARTAGDTFSGDINMGGNDITNVNEVDGVDVSNHAGRHIDGGADVVDADKAEISWTGYTAYTPDTSPAEVDATDQLTAHLAGIDDALGSVAGLSQIFSINPNEFLTTGTSKKVEANGYAAIEFGTNQTNFATISLFFHKAPASNVLVRVKFILKASASGSYVRIGSKVKARATGEDSSTAFDAETAEAVSITTTTIGEVFQSQLSFSSSLFADNDAVALHIGRDGAELIAGGSADDFSQAIQVIAVEVEVP